MKKMIYKGISTHNLKHIDVEIPEKRLMCIAGVSGSGKSSLAFGTIAAISMEEYTRLTSDQEYEQDYVIDEYGSVPMAIPLKQLNYNVNPRSTIATYFGLQRSLNYIIAKMSGVTMGLLNFNGDGHCPECMGLGFKKIPDKGAIIKWDIPIRDVPFECWRNSYKDFYKKLLGEYCLEIGVDPEKTLKQLSESKRNQLINGIGNQKHTIQYKNGNSTRKKTTCYFGPMIEIGGNKQIFPTVSFDSYTKSGKCPACGGSRLKSKVANVQVIKGIKISDIETATFNDLGGIFEKLCAKDKDITSAANNIIIFINKAIQLGLGHLTLTRGISGLSGGELQRLRLTQLLSGNLSDMLIVLDEPTASLHPSECEMVAKMIADLKIKNTILAVEHNEEVLKYADSVLYLGPQGGKDGGKVISREEFNKAVFVDSKKEYEDGNGIITVQPVSEYVSYKGELNIHLNTLNVICGSSGSGKSVILHDSLPSVLDNYMDISQKPIKGNSLSTVGTYTKLSDEVRACFAKKFKKDSSFFGKNGQVCCKCCGGNGYVDIGEYYGKAVKTVCSECSGTGYNESADDYKIGEISIATAAGMLLSELRKKLDFSKKALQTLDLLESVHLGYLSLNRNIGTLSGGENQRIKLVMALMKKKGMIIGLDEPVKGLSPKEIGSIIELLYAQIRDCDKTFIVSEHNTQFIDAASYVTELINNGEYTEIVYSDNRSGIEKCKKSLIKKWIQ